MKLEVIGCVGNSPTAEDVCPCYLVSHGATRLLLECGTGSLHLLQQRVALRDLSAVVITHMHSDHFLDLVPLAGRLLVEQQSTGQARRLRILLPPGGKAILEDIRDLLVRHRLTILTRKMFEVLAIEEFAQPSRVRIGDMTVHLSAPVEHDVITSAVRVEAGGKALCYSGDCAPCEAIEASARGVDLFLCGAAYAQRPAKRTILHMSPEEAGEIAARAGVKRLVLTKFSRSDAAWKQAYLPRARETFVGEVTLAQHGLVVEV
ncbi:MAG: MBL fold metallo-hydrolase [Chloroflexi bacterium]|nr:MBL fold metallo-hydrolase [Chloroflexota bacterium]